MDKQELAAQLLSFDNNGVYLLDAAHRQDLVDAAAQSNMQVQRVHCAQVSDKDSALAAIARDLRFPEWFGHNYDALVECLGDLEWLPESGIVLMFEDSEAWQHADPDSFGEVLEILQVGAEEWAETERVFQAFVVMGHEDYEAITAADAEG